MIYDLPTELNIDGITYEIRSDYRAILDICMAITDPNLNEWGKGMAALTIFYVDFESMPQESYNTALKECFKFINLGHDEEDNKRKPPKLMDWEQDFQYIIAPINRVVGKEIRAMEYLHWWTFIAAYYEIGDCTFAQIVRIRDMKRKGKKLDKTDAEWYRDHKELVDLKQTYSEAEKELFKQWGV